MKRIGIAAVAGGVVLFIWAFVSEMYIPWHETGTLPDQGAVTAALSDTGTTSGIYEFPGTAEGEAGEPEAEADGPEPAGLLMYSAGGGVPFVIERIIGLVLEVLVAAVAACLLTMAVPALPGFAGRLGFVVLLGVFMIVGADLMHWNSMHYPFRFTLEAAADSLVAALLLGIVLAIIIKPYTDLGEVEDVPDVEASADT
jgi:hypothetical protein